MFIYVQSNVSKVNIHKSVNNQNGSSLIMKIEEQKSNVVFVIFVISYICIVNLVLLLLVLVVSIWKNNGNVVVILSLICKRVRCVYIVGLRIILPLAYVKSVNLLSVRSVWISTINDNIWIDDILWISNLCFIDSLLIKTIDRKS